MEVAGGFGHRFRRTGLLQEALTHGSYRNDHEVADYERLEFLGDATLGLVVTEAIHFQRPHWSGQRRQEAKSELVSNQSLAGAARTLALEEAIRVGGGHGTGEAVRSSDRILANVFEAVLGAAYLDGGLPAARAVVRAALGKRLGQLGFAPPDQAPSPAPGARGRLRAAGGLLTRVARRLTRRRGAHERALGYTFVDPALLERALEAGGEAPAAGQGRRRRRRRESSRTAAGGPRKQALRFLGRDVMQLVAADALLKRFPEWDEGRMTLARMRLQERDFTSGLSRHWSLGTGAEAAGNAEALLGALYLDGDLSAARRALGKPFEAALRDLQDPDLELLDPKTQLQNRLAKEGREAPQYSVRRAGDGARQNGEVAVTLRLEGGIREIGRGRGLKEAEKNAAQRALDRLDRAAEQRRGGGGRPNPSPGKPNGGDRARPAPEPANAEAPAASADNPKGALQETLVKQEGRLPVYRVISESGPEHEKTFVVEVLVAGRRLGRGSGRSKRKAEAEAAAAALEAGV